MIPLNTPITNEVVTLNELVQDSVLHKDTNSCITFDYELSDKASKVKILRAADRSPLELEENSSSSNLVFSAGAWFHVVLPSVQYWTKVQGEQTCKIGDYQIKIGGVKPGKENNGKIVNTQIVFYAGRDKIVCHLYNTTQLVLVNGHGYQKFINTFLKPFFDSKVDEHAADIIQLNGEIREKLSSKTVKRSNIRYKKDTVYSCNKCDHVTKSIGTLKKHKTSEHTHSFNSSKQIEHKQSTRNNSIVEKIMIEDISVTDLTDDDREHRTEQPLKYTCDQCNHITTNKENIDDHIRSIHGSKDTMEVLFYCTDCGYEFEVAADYDHHIRVHETEKSKIKDNASNDIEKDVVHTVYMHILENYIDNITKAPYEDDPIFNENCHQCDHIALNDLELKKHIQTIHKVVKVDVSSNMVIKCTVCDYACNLNIKMKKHMEKQHEEKSIHKQTCNLCEFTAISVEHIWKHKLSNHTGETTKSNNMDKNSLVINLVAEQNIYLLEELSNLKKSFKEILEQFTRDADDHANEINTNARKQTLQTSNAIKVLTKEVIALREDPRMVPSSSSTLSSPPPPRASPTSSSISQPELKQTNTSVSSKPSRTPRQIKSRYQAKSRVLVVGDTLAKNVDFRKLEVVTNTTIRTASSHSFTGDRNTITKNNMSDVTRDMLEKENIDHLVVAAPDISNLVSRSMNPDDTKALKETVQTFCKNMLEVTENSLAEHSTLKNVTVVSHSLGSELKPFGLEQNLATLAEKYLLELWLSSPYKNKVFIGIQGKATYFESLQNILLSSLNKDDHTNCPQAKYTRLNSRRLYSTVLAGEAPLKTFNRFSPLSQMQGN